MQEAIYGLDRFAYVDYLKQGIRDIRELFSWQRRVLESNSKRKLINGSRQSGKSTIVSSVPCHSAKYYPESLSVVLAPTEKQALEDILKIKKYKYADPNFPNIINESKGEITLSNGSRIIVIPATETSARGYSKPRVIVLDEASRIPDLVYKSGVRPMLTDNPDCEVFSISTPNGKNGFFYEGYMSIDGRWEKYEIRSPWTVDPNNPWQLIPFMDEPDYIANRAKHGIYACYSPRHFNYSEQNENLQEIGRQQYMQEYCCEFVETEDMVFSYEEIDRAFGQAPEMGFEEDPFGIAPGIEGV